MYSTSIGGWFPTDFWGYYIGHEDEYPTQVVTDPGFYHHTSDDCLDYTAAGILESITNPLGGKTSFTYELNQFGFCGVRGNNGYAVNEVSNTFSGGLRVKEVTTNKGKRRFYYAIDYSPGSEPGRLKSSGVMRSAPWNTSSAFRPVKSNRRNVVYSEVVVQNFDESYTTYSYTTSRDYLDIPNYIHTTDYYYYAEQPEVMAGLELDHPLRSISLMDYVDSWLGNLKSVINYNLDYKVTTEEYNEYTLPAPANADYVSGIFTGSTLSESDRICFNQVRQNAGLPPLTYNGLPLACFASKYRIFTVRPLLKEKTIITHENGGNTKTVRNKYRYNSSNLIASAISYTSRGDSLETIYRYPDDIGTGVYATMSQVGQIGDPVEVLTLKNNRVIDGKLTTFAQWGSLFLPKDEYVLELTASVPRNNFSFYNGQTKDSRYSATPVIRYDQRNQTSGVVLQTTDQSGIVTSYLWDSTQQYQKASVINTTYSSISNLDLKDAAYNSRLLYDEIKSRSASGYPTTYAYKPLVGISESTDVRKKTEYYGYDQFGNLKNVRNDDNNITQQNEYGYSNIDQGTLIVSTVDLHLNPQWAEVLNIQVGSPWSITWDYPFADSGELPALKFSSISHPNSNNKEFLVGLEGRSLNERAQYIGLFGTIVVKTRTQERRIPFVVDDPETPRPIMLDQFEISPDTQYPLRLEVQANTAWRINKNGVGWVEFSIDHSTEYWTNIQVRIDPLSISDISYVHSGTVYFESEDGSFRVPLNVINKYNSQGH